MSRTGNRILESTFQNKVVKKLKTLKNTYFYKASDRSRVGIPDIILCVRGRFVAMELKRGKEFKPTEIQAYTLERIKAAYGDGLVVYPSNWNETFEWLKEMAGGVKNEA